MAQATYKELATASDRHPEDNMTDYRQEKDSMGDLNLPTTATMTFRPYGRLRTSSLVFRATSLESIC
jgi:hypothetical protein